MVGWLADLTKSLEDEAGVDDLRDDFGDLRDELVVVVMEEE